MRKPIKEMEEQIHQIMESEGITTEKKKQYDRNRDDLFSIQNIIIVASAYDFFLLEEEGRLSQLFRERYSRWGLGFNPRIRNVHSGEVAVSMLEGGWVDLMLIFNPPSDMDQFELARKAKSFQKDLLIVYLGNNTPEMDRVGLSIEADIFDGIFTWFGDGNIFLTIVSHMETISERSYLPSMPYSTITVLSGSIRDYSRILPICYQTIWEHMDILMGDAEYEKKVGIYRRRPRIHISNCHDEIKIEMGSEDGEIICLIIDDDEPLPESLVESNSTILPVLRIIRGQESDPANEMDGLTILSSDKEHLSRGIRGFILRSLHSTGIEFHDRYGKRISSANDLISLERAVCEMSGEDVIRNLSTKFFFRWLTGRSEFELADSIKRLIIDTTDPDKCRERLINFLGDHKRNAGKDYIRKYSRYGEDMDVHFTRIGKGPMGGKARGLAFMNGILSRYLPNGIYENLDIKIPKTIVLCTDIFERFLEENDLLSDELLNESDENIAERFIRSDLPSTLLGDLRSIVQEIKSPVSVRSSSLLEDALFQPFAGIYSSIMLANDSFDKDQRFEDLCSGIKYVYASTFFRKARNYIRSTSGSLEDEKMGIIIQEIAGKQHDNKFYPTISGVTRSYDFWPSDRCAREDGTVNLASGLGKTIVDGGVSYRFCPVHPSIPHYNDIEDLIENSQTTAYTIAMRRRVARTFLDEDSTLVQIGLKEMESHGQLDYIASTFSPADSRLYPGIGRDGTRVIDFAPILNLELIPLASCIRILLGICEVMLGCPVELEFAVNIEDSGDPYAVFHLLQVRSMVTDSGSEIVTIEDVNESEIILGSGRSLGNGINNEICNIVFVSDPNFDLSNSEEAREEIRKINERLIQEGKPYILIGPGRWGSTDRWLGIPVVWSEISMAKVIVELPVGERMIDPSQGSHFFQNMSSLKTFYLTLDNKEAGSINWNWIRHQKIVENGRHIIHSRTHSPVTIMVNGRNGKGIIKHEKDK